MHVRKLVSSFAALGLAVLTVAVPALADETHDTAIAPKSVSVSIKSGWHINKEYPWKLVAGEKKHDKSHFTFTETTAAVTDAPPGTWKLKGAVCAGDQCRTFEEDIVVPEK